MIKGVELVTIQIELSPEAESQLAAEAQVRGIAPEAYAGSLLNEFLRAASRPPKLSVEDFHILLHDFARGSERLPELPTESFTRESFYEDRG